MATFLTPDKPQVFFHVKDMTSERAADVVVDALKKLDAGAIVRIDLPMRRVEIDPTTAEPSAFRDAFSNAVIEPAIRPPTSLRSCNEEVEWIDRCRASICKGDPLLSADDVVDLATTLWDLPRCQRLPPEIAAEFLLTDQLGQLCPRRYAIARG